MRKKAARGGNRWQGAPSYYKQMLGNDDVIAHCLIWENSAPASGGNGPSMKYCTSSPAHVTRKDKSLCVYNSISDISNLQDTAMGFCVTYKFPYLFS